MNARLNMSSAISVQDDAYELYLSHLLDTIVSKGDAPETSHRHMRDTELAAQEIARTMPNMTTYQT
jgi:phosphatidylinositol 4-kinase